MSKLDSLLISYVRFPLAILVVAVHCFISVDGWSYADLSTYAITTNFFVFFEIAISHVLAHLAVPIFFLITGYLFFQKLEVWDTSVWKIKIKKRVFSLLIPYIVWILIYWVFLKCPSKFPSMFWCSEVWNTDRLDFWGNSAAAMAPLLIPMWFIRNLIVCILISPLIYFLMKKNILTFFVVPVILFLYFTQTSLIIPGFSMTAICFFCVGSFLCLNNKQLSFSWLPRIMIPCLLFFYCFLFSAEIAFDGNNTFWGNVFYPFFICVGVILVLYGMGLFSKSSKYQALKRSLLKLSECTFFIFAFHPFILRYADRLIKKILKMLFFENFDYTLISVQDHSFLMVFLFLLKILVATFGAVAIYLCVKKCFPCALKILCGR